MRATPSDPVLGGLHPSSEGDPPKGDISDAYEKSMDEMRCILYLHGGECPKCFLLGLSLNYCQAATISAALIRRGKQVPV